METSDADYDEMDETWSTDSESGGNDSHGGGETFAYSETGSDFPDTIEIHSRTAVRFLFARGLRDLLTTLIMPRQLEFYAAALPSHFARD